MPAGGGAARRAQGGRVPGPRAPAPRRSPRPWSGAPVSLPRRDAQRPGGPVLELRQVDVAGRRRPRRDRASTSPSTRTRSSASPASPATASAALAALLAGLAPATAGEVRLLGQALAGRRARAALPGPASAASPRTGSATAWWPSCSIAQNLALETCRSRGFQRLGLVRARAARGACARADPRPTTCAARGPPSASACSPAATSRSCCSAACSSWTRA